MSEQIMNENPETAQVQEESSTIERCLTFESGGLVMFLSTDYIIETITGYSITYIPMLPPFIKGIINLRGQLLPVRRYPPVYGQAGGGVYRQDLHHWH